MRFDGPTEVAFIDDWIGTRYTKVHMAAPQEPSSLSTMAVGLGNRILGRTEHGGSECCLRLKFCYPISI